MLTPAFHYDILKPDVGLLADFVQVMLASLSLSHLYAPTQSTTKKVYWQTCVSFTHPSDTAMQKTCSDLTVTGFPKTRWDRKVCRNQLG